MNADKIKPTHLARKAILYVRQSTAYQVENNHESQRLQYAMDHRLQSFGWKHIEVVDDDMGRSAAGAAVRSGFERMVSDVCLGKVGAVAARELSRFARNSREWQQLIEVCRMVEVLLIDHEMIYDPRLPNDRLLLGLKGTMNEYELDLLRIRGHEARLEKASRGEFPVPAPIGYQKNHDGRLEMTPDKRVQESIRLIFRKFFELGSARQVMFWFVEKDLTVPSLVRARDNATVKWRRPHYSIIQRILKSPIYAGAYVYGRTATEVSFEDGVPVSSVRYLDREQWHSLIPDHHEGYITWDEYEQIQVMLFNNRTNANVTGPALQGSALLTGLLRCRRCGRKLFVAYTGRDHKYPRYRCENGTLDNGEPKCIAFGGMSVDRRVSDEILEVVRPAAIEAASKAYEAYRDGEDEVLAVLHRELEAAEYASERARKQFDGVDPDNRLVADELENRWNKAMMRVHDIRCRIDRHETVQRKQTVSQIDVSHLSANLPTIWDDPNTDIRIKKRILRTLIQEIIVDVQPEPSEVVLVVHWNGGVHTEIRVPRRRRNEMVYQTNPDAVDAIRQLSLICTDELIAGLLNRNGYATATGKRWNCKRVSSIRHRYDIPARSQNPESSKWMNLTNAAAYLKISPKPLREAVERREIAAIHPLADGPWLFEQSTLDSSEARSLVQGIKTRRKRSGLRSSTQKPLFF